jgi:hypothetical protein
MHMLNSAITGTKFLTFRVLGIPCALALISCMINLFVKVQLIGTYIQYSIIRFEI